MKKLFLFVFVVFVVSSSSQGQTLFVPEQVGTSTSPGNVGIGTPTPKEKLDVNGRIKSSLGVYVTGLSNPTSWSGNAVDISFNGTLGALRSRNWTDNQWLPLYIQASKYIFDNGNIGIGTTNPDKLLHIYNGESGASAHGSSNLILESDAANFLSILTPGNQVAGIMFADPEGVHSGYLRYSHSDNEMSFYTNSSKRMVINNLGKIGIGNISPSEKLEISGNLLIDVYSSNSNGGLFFRKNFTSTSNEPRNLSIRLRDFNQGGLTPDGLEINGADGIVFGTLSQDRMIINRDGNVGIGTLLTGTHKLAVEGTIGAREIKVEAGTWSDFVFNKDYKLRTLTEVENFINKNKHLPDVPSEKEVLENGIALGEMDATLLQKIEELTLYAIEQNKQLKEQNKENKKQKTEIENLKELVRVQMEAMKAQKEAIERLSKKIEEIDN